MKILFDHEIFSSQIDGGITSYFRNIYYYINKKSEHQIDIFYLVSKNRFLKKIYGENKFSKLLPNKRLLLSFINNIYYFFLMKNEFSIYHSTLYSLKKIKSKKKVITIHDMIPEIYNWKKNPHKNKYKSAHQSDLIISVSEKTKRDIINCYKIPSKKIVVIPNCIDFNFWKKKAIKKFYNKDKYFLYVGDRLSPHKNFKFLLECFSEIKDNNIKLICCGGGHINNDEKDLLINYKIQNKVLFFKNLENEELKSLYQNSISYISVSIDEGFGIPPLEALASGTNIILNDIEVYREIYKYNELFYSFNDKKSLIEKMNSLIKKNISIINDKITKSLYNKYHLDFVLPKLKDCYEKLNDEA